MKRDNRTREERRRSRADFSAWVSFGCFLGLLALALAYILGGGLMGRRRQMKELPPCPRCGMYGGKRMVAQGNTDGFFVLCDSCGYRTKNYTDIAHAVRVWRETQL